MRSMIVPDKTYKIAAANKKCLRVSEDYQHENGDEIWLEQVYRNGAFFITPQDWDECDTLQAALEGEDIQIDEFSEWEFDSMYDICSEDTMGDTEKLDEAMDALEWIGYNDIEEWLCEKDFKHIKTYYEIQDGIILSDDEHS